MLKKDYIVRQLEEFGKVMAVILGFKKQADFEKFTAEIAEASKKFTSLEMGYVENLLPGDFEKEILNHPTLMPEQFKILADLLYEKMIYYGETNETEKFAHLKAKCILLYKKYFENLTQNEFNLEVHYRLGMLEKL